MVAKQKNTVKTRYGLFEILLERDGKGYFVSVPRLPEVITGGTTLTHAKRMAVEAIEVAIEGDVLSRAEKSGRVRFVSKARARVA